MNCSFMLRAVRVSRLAEVEQRLGLVSPPELLPPAQRRNPAQDGRSKRRAAVTAGPTSRKKVRESGLASKVGQLTAGPSSWPFRLGLVQGGQVLLLLRQPPWSRRKMCFLWQRQLPSLLNTSRMGSYRTQPPVPPQRAPVLRPAALLVLLRTTQWEPSFVWPWPVCS